MRVYPGTDMLMRICYSADCQKLISELSDLWVDLDSNCCVCTACRDSSRQDYDTESEWLVSVIPAASVWDRDVNEMEEG